MNGVKESGPTRIETLLAGKPIEVQRIDGTRESVWIIQIPISKIREYIAALDDEAAVISLYTGWPKELADTLTHESVELVITEGERINLDFLTRWCQRQKARGERLNAVAESAAPTSPATPQRRPVDAESVSTPPSDTARPG